MLILTYTRHSLKILELWFLDEPIPTSNKFHKVVYMQCKRKINNRGLKRYEFPTATLDLTKSYDYLWGRMKKKSCRYAITKAKKDGIFIEPTRGHHSFDSFKDRLCEFYKHKGLGVPSPDYFKNIRNKVIIFDAWKGGDIIVSNMYLYDPKNFRLLFSLSNGDTDSGNANKLAHWEAIKYAKRYGAKRYDFGGVVLDRKSPLYPNTKFKLSFGSEVEMTYNYRYHTGLFGFLLEAWNILFKRFIKDG